MADLGAFEASRAILVKLRFLEKRLAGQREQLEGLRVQVAAMRRVFDAAKRYVLTPFDEKREERLAAELEAAVQDAIAGQSLPRRPEPTGIPSVGRRRQG